MVASERVRRGVSSVDQLIRFFPVRVTLDTCADACSRYVSFSTPSISLSLPAQFTTPSFTNYYCSLAISVPIHPTPYLKSNYQLDTIIVHSISSMSRPVPAKLTEWAPLHALLTEIPSHHMHPLRISVAPIQEIASYLY